MLSTHSISIPISLFWILWVILFLLIFINSKCFFQGHWTLSFSKTLKVLILHDPPVALIEVNVSIFGLSPRYPVTWLNITYLSSFIISSYPTLKLDFYTTWCRTSLSCSSYLQIILLIIRALDIICILTNYLHWRYLLDAVCLHFDILYSLEMFPVSSLCGYFINAFPPIPANCSSSNLLQHRK